MPNVSTIIPPRPRNSATLWMKSLVIRAFLCDLGNGLSGRSRDPARQGNCMSTSNSLKPDGASRVEPTMSDSLLSVRPASEPARPAPILDVLPVREPAAREAALPQVIPVAEHIQPAIDVLPAIAELAPPVVDVTLP